MTGYQQNLEATYEQQAARSKRQLLPMNAENAATKQLESTRGRGD